MSNYRAGFNDPTQNIALARVEREERTLRDAIKARQKRDFHLVDLLKDRGSLPLVFICCRYDGDVKRCAERAKHYCRFAIDHERVPIAPTLHYPQLFDFHDHAEVAAASACAEAVLDKCSEFWVFGTDLSLVMRLLYQRAADRGIRIRNFTETCEVMSREYAEKLYDERWKA